ncbi:MAG: hypothetical protein VKI81_00905 [Synechococcaceae cyanobacterium]|nr:hypothetical protein [Synechococcaceae cyanobacterium]
MKKKLTTPLPSARLRSTPCHRRDSDLTEVTPSPHEEVWASPQRRRYLASLNDTRQVA